MAAPLPPDTGPPMLLRVAGLVTFVALAALDALVGDWDPPLWSYSSAVVVLIWGPAMLALVGRKP